MPDRVEVKAFRQCFTTRCPVGFYDAEVMICPLCSVLGPYVGQAAKIHVEPSQDETDYEGFQQASLDDLT